MMSIRKYINLVALLISITLTFSANINVFAMTSTDENESQSISEETVDEKESIFVQYDYVYLKTPNGTSVQAKKYKNELSSEEIANLDATYSQQYPQATLVHSASALYNCHSYAWYQNSSENEYVIENPEPYYYDDSYIMVDSPRVGDIVCYFNIYMDNIHSGIVKKVDAGDSNGVCGKSNLIWVESKWGDAGVFYHRGDQCPYTSYSPQYNNCSDEVQDLRFAYMIKFYRPKVDEVAQFNLNNEELNYEYDKSIDYNSTSSTKRYSMCELNINDTSSYLFEVSGDSAFTLRIYDENMNIMLESNSDTIVYKSFIKLLDLNKGRYYLRIADYDDDSAANINVVVSHHHNLLNEINNDETHTVYCDDCNYTLVETHNYNYDVVDANYHILKCMCGLTSGSNQGHIYTTYEDDNYAKCKYCNYLKHLGGTFIPVIKNKKVIVQPIFIE